ncbi:hypothetical protein SGRI78S_00030 [Streptomyces griseus subsp. griseus]
MLVGQAAEAFLLWRGVRPEVDEVMDMLRSTVKPISLPYCCAQWMNSRQIRSD